MIAIGIGLFLAGKVLMILFGTNRRWTHNVADWIGAFSLLFGVLIFFAGIVKLAWEYLP